VLGWGVSGGEPIGDTNPWALPGYTHQSGNNLLWEPLMYFGIFKNEFIPWLADSMEYNKDFTNLEIKLNKDAQWSDGTPVTSADVAYTFEQQAKNDKLPYHANFQAMDSVTTPDPLTVELKFKSPAPRFKFEVLTLKFDTGIPIVPKAWEEKQKDYTAALGTTEIPHSGPYNIVAWDATQKIYELRPDWWAIKAGRRALPAVKRVIISNTITAPVDTVAQRLVNNEFDSSTDMRAQIIGNILEQNTDITSWTGNESPYGYLDWWPNSLWMNTQLAPYSDPRVRKAISLTIDRSKIDEVLYDGAKVATIYPFPLYPNLQKFADSPEVKAEEAKYNPGEFNLDKSAQLMTEAGFTKNGDGLWTKDGKTVDATIDAFESIHGDIAPVLVEMLRDGGFDANVNFGTDAQQNMTDGKAGLYLFGHGASLFDPFEAMNLFAGKYSTPIGTSAGNSRWSRYNNPEFDKLLDDASPLGSDDPKFQSDLAQALGIYWRDVIDVPVIQWLHRIPYNNHYWTNWPSKTNLADGTNGAFWAHTGMLVITGLKPSGK
jgi:peptide/nickel transport system substrate-binding protein